MKKYVTFVKDEEESACVISAVQQAGFDTLGSVYHMNFLFIEGGEHVRQGDFIVAAEEVSDGNYIAIRAHRIISDPFQLDGAKKPEEMIDIDGALWSKSTIKEALKKHTG